jgi:hypothetical protein
MTRQGAAQSLSGDREAGSRRSAIHRGERLSRKGMNAAALSGRCWHIRCSRRKAMSGLVVLLIGQLVSGPVAGAQEATPGPAPVSTPETLTIRKVACAAPCQVEGRLVLSERELVFEVGKKHRIVVPFERIRGVQTYLGVKQDAPIPDPGAGFVWGFVKHKKSGFVFDYTSERGGTMGLVLLTDTKDGPALLDWLTRFGVPTRDLVVPAAKKVP